MGIVLGPNQYGKAETRLVRVRRDGARHDLVDLNVSTALAGDLADVHLRGDNAHVLATDTQKNTVYAFAREHGIESIEDFGLLLARHFVDSQPPIYRARVGIERYAWQRLGDHSFQRAGAEVRTATVTYDGRVSTVVAGLTGLTLLNSTGSEFRGFVRDRYTTLPETRERILATAVDARWRCLASDVDWEESYAQARRLLVEGFVETHSLSLQQTLYEMGRRVLAGRPEIVEVRLALPNKHHFLVDLAPFGLDNPDEVYLAADRPYGLIEGTVCRDGAPEPGLAWW
ncbi:MAG TPA: urate oxidase [Rugosimonospora sp.]|nr:urate oxidase [Rugosimonospora sp.]